MCHQAHGHEGTSWISPLSTLTCGPAPHASLFFLTLFFIKRKKKRKGEVRSSIKSSQRLIAIRQVWLREPKEEEASVISDQEQRKMR
jgi:hypothetical protein